MPKKSRENDGSDDVVEAIPDTPENVVRAITQGPPKTDWRFLKPKAGIKEDGPN